MRAARTEPGLQPDSSSTPFRAHAQIEANLQVSGLITN